MHPGRWLWLIPLLILPVAADEIVWSAVDFDDANIRVSQTGENYADGPACIWNGGPMPNRAEYLLDLPAGDYTLSILFAAQQPRPIEIRVDGELALTGCKGTTGSWKTSTAKWEEEGKLSLTAGQHLFELVKANGPFPHICAVKLVPEQPLPNGWQLKRLTPEQRAARIAERERRERAAAAVAKLRSVDLTAVRLAVDDLAKSYPEQYDAATHRREIEGFAASRDKLLARLSAGQEVGTEAVDQVLAPVRAALLANPLLDFDRLLVVQRKFAGKAARSVTGGNAGFVPANYLTHVSIARKGWDNQVAVLTNLRTTPKLTEVFQPAAGRIVRDVCLDWPAQRMLFTSVDEHERLAVFQVKLDGTGLEQLSPTGYPDLDFFQATYLPNGKVILCSTANYQGLPCLDGKEPIASLYLLDPATHQLRQLTFDQDSDNDPTVLNDGRVLYQRWEYSDIPHYFSRLLFCMNPDGTMQTALYGRNSWFPTAARFAKPVPDHPSKLVAILSGHHDFGDCGRLALLDPALASGYPFKFHPTSKEWGVEGQRIAVTPEILPANRTGLLQLIPGRDQMVPGTVCDAIVTDVFRPDVTSLTTNPQPLSSKYFLVSMKPTPQSLWGIYLVDIFDNATLLAEVEGAALFEPQPLVERPRPPIIPDRVELDSPTAEVQIQDIYVGPGLAGVPRGTIKRLRVFAYHFGYLNRAGFPLIGVQSGWDVKRILGTAEVEPDGSACFDIPANTPVSLQPLDDEGRAVQLMRSWFVGMPGERISCVGCHEKRMATIPNQPTKAQLRGSRKLTEWYGPARPFAFATEVYPVLQRHCVGCHQQPATVGPRSKPCFAAADTAYATLHPYLHRGGVESDIALLTPMEYHASTSPLFQMLEKGHHGVELSAEARDRLVTWLDLNVPRAGAWDPPAYQERDQRQRRLQLAAEFGGCPVDPEGEFQAAQAAVASKPTPEFIRPPAQPTPADDGLRAVGFPFTAVQAKQLQATAPAGTTFAVDLAPGVRMQFTWIPAGEFIMGRLHGAPDERPRAVVRIDQPFWMGTTEVTNGQYAVFDPAHDTRYVDMHYMDHTVPGHIANHPDQPVARVSWESSAQFCQWLSQRTGLQASLPTEAQWEWAARAGTETQFWYGTLQADWGQSANLADQSLRWSRMSFDGASALPIRKPYPPELNFPLHDERFRDVWHVVDYVGQTQPNPWGLRDMVGNVSEWTASSYRADPGRDERKVARGGSWADRPVDAGSSVRRAYESWQQVYDVGFRVILKP